MKQLTQKEEEIMERMWDHGPMLVRELQACYDEPRPHVNTLATLMKILEEKGFLGRRPMANSFQYTALISEKEYRGSTIGDVVAKYYDNSYSQLVSQFVEDEKMDLDELKELIEKIEQS